MDALDISRPHRDLPLTASAITHAIVGRLRPSSASTVAAADTDDVAGRDRGAVSIEQVLWYAAAAISVAVVATIIWSQVRTTASTPVNMPSAP